MGDERPRHPRVTCDACKAGVVGLRFKCRTGPNYDLCEECMARRSHRNHPMILIRHPQVIVERLMFPELHPIFNQEKETQEGKETQEETNKKEANSLAVATKERQAASPSQTKKNTISQPIKSEMKMHTTQSRPERLDPRKLKTKFDIGSTVEIDTSAEPMYGIIRWIGHRGEPSKPIAGLEMEENVPSGTDGTLGECRLFNCAPDRALFVYLHKCRSDSRFTVEDKDQQLAQKREQVTPDDSPKCVLQPRFTSLTQIDPQKLNTELELGSMVEVQISGSMIYGVVKWIGHQGNPFSSIAGLEMEDDLEFGMDGTLGGQHVFECAPKRGVFMHLSKCQADSRFSQVAKPKDKLGKEDTPGRRINEPVATDKDCDTGGLTQSSVIVVSTDVEKQIGVVKWLGHFGDKTKIIAGVEMVEAFDKGNNGNISDKKLFDCKPGRGRFLNCQLKERTATIPNIPASQNNQAAPSSKHTSQQSPGAPTALDADQYPEGIKLGCKIIMSHQGRQLPGHLRWIGYVKDPTKVIVGVETDDDTEGAKDGKLGQHQLFKCDNGRALFTKLDNCKY